MGGTIRPFKMEIFYTFSKVNSAEFALQALEKYCTQKKIATPANIRLLQSKGGKPFANISGVHFSLTHTKGLTLIATADRELGIDAENIREVDYRPILKKYGVKTGVKDSSDFLWWWTKKEAQAKLLDIPLANSLRLSDPLANFIAIKEIEGFIITLAYYGMPEIFSLEEIPPI